jgi:hypothetical protein
MIHQRTKWPARLQRSLLRKNLNPTCNKISPTQLNVFLIKKSFVSSNQQRFEFSVQSGGSRLSYSVGPGHSDSDSEHNSPVRLEAPAHTSFGPGPWLHNSARVSAKNCHCRGSCGSLQHTYQIIRLYIVVKGETGRLRINIGL